MKWKILKLFLPLLLLGFVIPMIMPGADGKPVMSYQDWLPDKTTLDSLQRKAKQGAQAIGGVLDSGAKSLGSESSELSGGLEQLGGGSLSSKKVYKWQDEFGQWHFTDDPKVAERRSANASDVEQQALSYPANAMPAPSPAPAPVPASETPAAAPAETFEPSLKNAPRVMDEAKRVKELLEQRYRDTEQL